MSQRLVVRGVAWLFLAALVVGETALMQHIVSSTIAKHEPPFWALFVLLFAFVIAQALRQRGTR